MQTTKGKKIIMIDSKFHCFNFYRLISTDYHSFLAVIIQTESLVIGPDPIFQADHPFFYYIIDNNHQNNILALFNGILR